ncbi:two-component sensor histidine kinase [Sporosarcina sp. P37]|uniref:sensor histidine kinase n=1 Tax=unclassified Sporosarcina TaxID=2647733 RepID=UPI000A17AF0B|nr:MULTISPECIES: HAMP domain-containing sensor histidine kinase [unclassified Sporosarcina]ARK24435.1 two-component sensor histidine kinase [Sporosarcina sp. P37]PID17601.1 two-component sensor histidine kinase [Sporosarcina sp. P35]
MNKISTKLAASFIIIFLLLESVLMIYLHQNIIHARVDEEYSRLLASGSNHRDVLEDYYSDKTIAHIVLMETGKEREVIITDEKREIISSSADSLENFSSALSLISKNDETDRIVVTDWKNSPFIASVHPYKAGAGQSGYVVMFQSSQPIEMLVQKLNLHFGLAGSVSIVILFIIYFILSKFLTRPLIRMKEATERLSEGKFDVSLPGASNDELGELSAAIMKLATDLEKMKTERNEFLASVSHELSTPLTYLIGYLKVAMREELSDGKRNHYLQIIAEESNRMKDLVKDLMELAKMDEVTFTVTRSQFSAQEFIEDMNRLMAPSFDMKKIRLVMSCKEDFQLVADRIRLEQIVLNLLDNALKYSDEQTTVTLEIYQEQQQTVLSVTDEGMGIPSNEIDRIFDKLYRVEKSRSRAFGGSGLGLAIVKELVEAHGGTITVKSEAGKGSTFIITI